MGADGSGTADPDTLYMRQNCIGGGSFGKVYKGCSLLMHGDCGAPLLNAFIGSIVEPVKLLQSR